MLTTDEIVKAEPRLAEFFNILSNTERTLSPELEKKVSMLGVLLINAGQRGITVGMFEDILPIALGIVGEVKNEVHLNGV